MGGSVCGQVRCFIWRHFLAYVRQWPWVLGSVVVGVAPFLLLALLRTTAQPTHRDQCHFMSRTLWSGHGASLVQSFVCTLDNACQQDVAASSDMPYQYPGAAFNELLNATLWGRDGDSGGGDGEMSGLPSSLVTLSKVASLLNTPGLSALMENGVRVSDLVTSSDDLKAKLTSDHDLDPELIDSLLQAKVNVPRVLSLVGYRDPKSVVCSPNHLSQFLLLPDNNTSTLIDLSTALCDLPLAQVTNITATFLTSVDPAPFISKVRGVVESTGNYDAGDTLNRVEGLVRSLGRLESMAPLAAVLSSLSVALAPLMTAMDSLTQSGWDASSVSELMTLVSDVGETLAFSSSSTQTSPLHQASRSVALLLDRNNMTALATDQSSHDPWIEVLTQAGGAIEEASNGLERLAHKLQQHTPTHTLLVTLTATLPSLLTPNALNLTRLGADLDTGVGRLVPEVGRPVNATLTMILPALHMAASITQASDIVVSFLVQEPPLPIQPAITLAEMLSNFSHIQTLIQENSLASWLCMRESWSNLTDNEFEVVEERLCTTSGVLDIHRITELLATPINHTRIKEIFKSKREVRPSEILSSLKKLCEVVRSSRYLKYHLPFPQDNNNDNSSIGSRKKRYVMYASSNNNNNNHHHPTTTASTSSSSIRRKRSVTNTTGELEILLMSLLNETEIKELLSDIGEGDLGKMLFKFQSLDSDVYMAFKEGIQLTKFVIRKVAAIYLNLLREVSVQFRTEEGGAEEWQDNNKNNTNVNALTSMEAISGLEDITTLFLDTLLQLSSVTVNEGWSVMDMIKNPHLSKLLTHLLRQNVLEAAHKGLSLLKKELVMEMSPPYPQLLNLLNASSLLLQDVVREDNVWAWCADDCIHTSHFLHQAVHLLPQLLIIPLHWGIEGLSQDTIEILTNVSLWRNYPCYGDDFASVADLLPSSLPPSTGNGGTAEERLRQAEERVRQLEEYICQNFSKIMDEVTSHLPLTKALKYFVEELVPGEVNMQATLSILKSLATSLTLLDPMEVLDNLTLTQDAVHVITREFKEAFNMDFNIFTGQSFLRLARDLSKEMTTTSLALILTDDHHHHTLHTLRYTLYHTHNILVTFTNLIQGNMSLMAILGLDKGAVRDDTPLSLILRGPKGTADFLTGELATLPWSSLLGGNTSWTEWMIGMCNRNNNKDSISNNNNGGGGGGSAWVSAVCMFTLHSLGHSTPPLWPQNNLTAAVVSALTDYRNSNSSTVPEINLSQITDAISNLIEAIQKGDVTHKMDLSGVERLMNETREELKEFVDNFSDFHQGWLFKILDNGLRQTDETGNLVRQVHTLLTWLIPLLPQNPDNLMASIPEEIKEIHSKLNCSWPVLLVGLHYNLLHNKSLFMNISFERVCTSLPLLIDLEYNGASFLMAVDELCGIVLNASNAQQSINTWLQYEQLIQDLQNNSGEVPSTQEAFRQLMSLMDLMPVVWGPIFRQEIKFPLPLPSYLSLQQWKDLLTKLNDAHINDGNSSAGSPEELVLSLMRDLLQLHSLDVNNTIEDFVTMVTGQILGQQLGLANITSTLEELTLVIKNVLHSYTNNNNNNLGNVLGLARDFMQNFLMVLRSLSGLGTIGEALTAVENFLKSSNDTLLNLVAIFEDFSQQYNFHDSSAISFGNVVELAHNIIQQFSGFPSNQSSDSNTTIGIYGSAFQFFEDWLQQQQQGGLSLSPLLKLPCLYSTLLHYLTAESLEELLNERPALWFVADTFISHTPPAIQDIISIIHNNSSDLRNLLTKLVNVSEWDGVCETNFTTTTPHLDAFFLRLCQISPQALLIDVRAFFVIDFLLQNETEIEIERALNCSTSVAMSIYSIFNSSSSFSPLAPVLSDPIAFFDLGAWGSLPRLLFNATPDELWTNRSLVLSTLLEPLVSLSREPEDELGPYVRGALGVVEGVLRWIRLSLAVAHGGDVWEHVKETYLDKPLVVEMMEVVDELPHLALQYLTFFSNDTVISEATATLNNSSNNITWAEMCALHQTLIENHRHLPEASKSGILSTAVTLLCDSERLSLLALQIQPDRPPVIGNTTMDLDTAVLTGLIDTVVRDVVDVWWEGQFYQPLILPAWMEDGKWMEVVEKAYKILDMPVMKAIVKVLGLHISSLHTFVDSDSVIKVAAVLYHISSRLADSIDEMKGVIEWTEMANGLGTVDELLSLSAKMPDTLISIISWFSQSQMTYRLTAIRKTHDAMNVYREMCATSASDFLHHPGLNVEEWDDVHFLLCNFSLHGLLQDASPLLSSSEVLLADGGRIDWDKVSDTVVRAVEKVKMLNFAELPKPLQQNAYTAEQSKLSPAQHVWYGLVSAFHSLLPNPGWKEKPRVRHQLAQALVGVTTFLSPITAKGEAPFLTRLLHGPRFKDLLANYTNILQDIQQQLAKLDNVYLMEMMTNSTKLQGMLGDMAEQLNESTEALEQLWWAELMTNEVNRLCEWRMTRDEIVTVLAELASLPVGEWRTLVEGEGRHFTPMHLTHLLSISVSIGPYVVNGIDRTEVMNLEKYAMNNLNYWEVWYNFSQTMKALSSLLLPQDYTLTRAFSELPEIAFMVAGNVLDNIDGVIRVAKTPFCVNLETHDDDRGRGVKTVASRWIGIIKRQTERWQQYVELICDVPDSNLTHVMNGLLYRVDWQGEVEVILGHHDNDSLTCSYLVEELAITSEKVRMIVKYFREDETAWEEVENCLSSSLNSTTMLQFRGLLMALGEVLGSGGSNNNSNSTDETPITSFSASMADHPGASSALRTLGSCVAVMVPITDIFVRDYKQRFSPDVVAAIERLLVDVNRVYGAKVETLSILMSSVSEMRKWMKVRPKEGEDGENRVRRSIEEEEETENNEERDKKVMKIDTESEPSRNTDRNEEMKGDSKKYNNNGIRRKRSATRTTSKYNDNRRIRTKRRNRGKRSATTATNNNNTNPLEVLQQVVGEFGSDIFAEKLLDNVNFTFLLTKIDDLRLKTLVTSDWLDPVIVHTKAAMTTLSKLSHLGAVMDLEKIVAGEVDPVTFLSGSLQLVQMRLWQDLAQSLKGLLAEDVELVSGSELGEDLERVVEGIGALQDATNTATLDTNFAVESLMSNWTEVESYLEEILGLDEDVVDVLASSKIDMLELLSLEDTTLESIVCEGGWQRRGLVTLPSASTATATNATNAITAALCSTTNHSQDLAAIFLTHLDLAPVIYTLTKHSLNTSLSHHNLSLEEVVEAVREVSTASHSLLQLTHSLRLLRVVSRVFPSPSDSSSSLPGMLALHEEVPAQAFLRDFSSPTFLERAGTTLCGKPLVFIPDSLGVLSAANPPHHDKKAKGHHQHHHESMEQRDNDDDVCDALYKDLREMPGGGILLHYIKALLAGRIFYTPDNAATRAIIRQANQTFQAVERQASKLKKLLATSQLLTPLQNQTQFQELQKTLELTWVQGMVDYLLQSTTTSVSLPSASSSLTSNLTERLRQATPEIEEISTLLEEFSDVLDVGLGLLSCLELDKFTGVESEGELLKEARKASDKQQFLAGIVFSGVGESGETDETLPPHLTYTIRVDVEKTPSTLLLTPRFWRPGPYTNFAADMKYHQGFIQLQDLIERAVLRVKYSQQRSTGERKKRDVLDSAALHATLSDDARHWTPWETDHQSRVRVRRQTTKTTAEVAVLPDERDALLNMAIYTQHQPYPCYTQDDFVGMLNESPVMSFVFSFVSFTIYTVFLIQQLVHERESRNRQVQEVMGLRGWLDDLVWFMYAFLLLLVVCVVAAVVVVFGGLQPHTHFGLLLAFLLCYGLSIIAFCYLVGSIVPSTVLAVFVGVMTLLLFNIPFLTISVIPSHTPFYIICITCLLPSSAFGFGFRVLCQYEMQRMGIAYNNLWQPPVTNSSMTLGVAMEMLLLDSLIFLTIAIIINIFSTVRCSSFKKPATIKVSPAKQDLFTKMKDAVHILDLDPGLKQSLKKGLMLVGVRKMYQGLGSGGSKLAVDNLSLELYEGQVLALLGHNGAGKTTIISMLTRGVQPTAGNIQIYGHDINSQSGWDAARNMIGLCPQQSVLFPLLTVAETLTYYARLKEGDTHTDEINSTLETMGLHHHRNHRIRQLSEGLRRRLCLAVAFVGGSKLVVLDEPTSGIDPAARSAVWEVISSHREGRTILLTTHHLDEAETLADRVAVIHQGRLLCVGSPLALKSEYGLGYSVTLSKRTALKDPRPHTTTTATATTTTTTSSPRHSPVPPHTPKTPDIVSGDVDGVLKLLTKHVPKARLLETVNDEATFAIPFHHNKDNDDRFADMFGELETHMESLGWTSVELRPTSLEDVIIALTSLTTTTTTMTSNQDKFMPPSTKQELSEVTFLPPSSSPEKPVSVTTKSLGTQHTRRGIALGLQRLRALLYKRLLHHVRDWRFYVMMLLLPMAFILLAILGSKCRPSHEESATITLGSSTYPPPATTFLRVLNPTLEPLGREIVKLVVGADDDNSSNIGSWSSCPKPHSIPGFPNCHDDNKTLPSSPCQCVDERCAVNASDQLDINSWLIHTRWQHTHDRNGGITLGVEDPRVGDDNSSGGGAMVWYDNTAYHTLPAHLNLLTNARLRRLMGPGHSVTARNKPIVFSSHGLRTMTLQRNVADLGIGLLVLVALTAVCSASPGYSVAERVRGERRVLLVSGVSRVGYWAAAMIWDTLLLVVNILLITLVLWIFNEQQFVWRDNLPAFMLISVLYGLSILPLFYLTEGWFNSEASAVFSFFCSMFGVGLITSLAHIICQTMYTIKTLNDIGGVIKYVFLVFPPFAFTCGIKDLAVLYTKTTIMENYNLAAYQSPLRWDPELGGGLGVYLVALALWVLVGILLLVLTPSCGGSIGTKSKSTAQMKGRSEEDRDVAAERLKLQRGGELLYDSVLRLVGVGCDYPSSPPVTAVVDLYLALKRGECFSLLGVNGAGKTTTFRCLTGDLQPTRGQILVDGTPLTQALSRPHPVLGYCPQSHALDPFLTPHEALKFMALVRGFPESEINQVVERAVQMLGLEEEAGTYTGKLSGGNQRKVSTALALLGDPQLVLLDEPTSGMDPASRRLVWSAVRDVTESGRSVLLTSHSLDEVDQLAHRMAIMVNGQLVCLGSPHYLKHKLGDKYTIRLKTQDMEDLTYVIDFLRDQLTDILLKEQHHLSLVVEVSRDLPLSLLFTTLAATRAMGVTEYSISQTTLNQVFRVLTSYQGDGQTSQPTSVPSPIRTGDHTLPSITHPQQEDTLRFSDPPDSLAPVDCDGRRQSTASLYDNLHLGATQESKNNSNTGILSATSWETSNAGIHSARRQINSNTSLFSGDGRGQNDILGGLVNGGSGQNNNTSGLFDSDFSSASDSPEEEWTHF